MKKEVLQCKIILKIKWCGRKSSTVEVLPKLFGNELGVLVDVCVCLCIIFCGYVKMLT